MGKCRYHIKPEIWWALSQTVNGYINTYADSQYIQYDKKGGRGVNDTQRGKNAGKAAYHYHHRGNNRQFRSPFTVDYTAHAFTDTVAGPGTQKQVQDDKICIKTQDSPQKTVSDGYYQSDAGRQQHLFIAYLKGGEFIDAGTFTATGAHRCFHHASGAYRLIAFTAAKIGFYIRVSGTSHTIHSSLLLASFLLADPCFGIPDIPVE
jgi:hypothetical protein